MNGHEVLDYFADKRDESRDIALQRLWDARKLLCEAADASLWAHVPGLHGGINEAVEAITQLRILIHTREAK
jgi:hypothetical protein